MNSILIEGLHIGPSHPPFIVAEISANHQHSLPTALKMVEAAKNAGVQAIKLQTYLPETITLPISEGEFLIQDPSSIWHGRSLYDLYSEAYTPWEWHQPLFQKAKELGLIAFSTPFDESAVEFLETLNVPCYKIASLEITHLPLIRKVASTGKPLFLSTGGAALGEIEDAVTAARQAGCQAITLLKCTTAYPAPAYTANLNTLPHLATAFQTLVGLSDHTEGIGVAIASIALGGCVIEKHFTLSRSARSVDAPFSLEAHELQNLVLESRRAWEGLGKISYGPLPEERTIHALRRSLYFAKDMRAGSQISEADIKIVRPGRGIAPKELPHIMGAVLQADVKQGEPVSWKVFQK